MSHEPTPGLEDTLRTIELQARIETDLGIKINASTIRAWTLREKDPLPVAYKGKAGQAHRFRWPDFLSWYLAEQERDAESMADDGDGDLDRLDWHAARTVSARERAKRDIVETRRIEGRYADVSAMEQAAKDRALHAVQLLRTLPSRVSPQLAAMTDELEIDRLLDAEIRAVCAEIERTSIAAIDADLETKEHPIAEEISA